MRSRFNLQRFHFAASLLTIHGILVAWNAVAISPVVDERAHLVSGISIWMTGRYDVYCVNPPLVKQIAAIPAMILGFEGNPEIFNARDNEVRTEGWRSMQFVASNGARALSLVTWGRLLCVPFALVGLWTCIRWSTELYGPVSGLFAGALWCVSPSVLAHAPLITADCAATSLGLLAGYLYWHWLRDRQWGQALAAGAALGVALLTKTLWIILFGLWPVLWLAWLLSARRSAKRECRQDDSTPLVAHAQQLGAMLSLALLILNVGYLFEGTLTQLGGYRFQSGALSGKDTARFGPGNRFADSWIGRIPVPLPANYLRGIDLQKRDFEDYPFGAYLRGHTQRRGWWYYYLYAFGVKETVGFIGILTGAVLVTLALFQLRIQWRDELILLIPAGVVFVLISAETGLNHHFRYALPALAPLFVFASKVVAPQPPLLWLRRSAALVLLSLAAASSLAVYPYSIGYFNELAGGTTNGWRHLDDSNTDWGQGLYALKRWLKKHPDRTPVYFARWGPTIDPQVIGLKLAPMLPTNRSHSGALFRGEAHGPVPGWHVISTNEIIEQDYDYLHELTPLECIAGCYLVYLVTEEQAHRIRMERGLPAVDTKALTGK